MTNAEEKMEKMMAPIELECEECGCRCTQNEDGSLMPLAQHDGVSGELAELIRKAQSHMLRTPEADAISVKLTQYLLNAGTLENIETGRITLDEMIAALQAQKESGVPGDTLIGIPERDNNGRGGFVKLDIEPRSCPLPRRR